MNPTSFDHISKRFAERRLSRRQALIAGSAGAALASAGFAPAAAQEDDATPAATPESVPVEPWDGEKTTYLFVQSFHAGSIVPTEGEDGRYTVTLEQGTGQTIYFGDRPSRDVGAAPTAQFLEGLGFSADNPPNAALIVETASGETDTAVVELFNPSYDPETRGVTYDVEVLENWQEDLELGLHEAPADLAALAPAFGAAHLLIDDCPRSSIECRSITDGSLVLGIYDFNYCFDRYVCVPCDPYFDNQPEDPCEVQAYWDDWCTEALAEFGCSGGCYAYFSWPVSRDCIR